MVATISSSFVTQFSDVMHMLLQQEGSVLRNVFPVSKAKGEKHDFERLGKFSASEVVSRLQPTNWQDAAHSRRVAFVRQYEAATTLSSIDELKMLIDPTNGYTKGLVNAQGRNFDSVIINALLGTANTGVDGSGTQAFDTANNQIAHGSTGLTLAKVDQALRMLESYDVNIDREPLVLIVNGRGKEDMIGDTSNRLVSIDYQNSKFLAGGGPVPTYRGVKIVTTQLIPDSTSGSVYRAILCTQDALRVALAEDIRVEVAKLPEHSFALGIATYMMFGAVRMEENRVIDILFQ